MDEAHREQADNCQQNQQAVTNNEANKLDRIDICALLSALDQRLEQDRKDNQNCDVPKQVDHRKYLLPFLHSFDLAVRVWGSEGQPEQAGCLEVVPGEDPVVACEEDYFGQEKRFIFPKILPKQIRNLHTKLKWVQRY